MVNNMAMLPYNSEWQLYHGTAANYSGKEFYTIGHWAQFYKTFCFGNLPPFHGHTVILCYKAALPW
jgi:hypothetical protein